ncbi:MAG: zinc ribbon domain-containing protein, partial [Clostridiales Family XIII bacterium]|nr:zinc ribbon domain-containing protein [Clostridiales Family XIII bacterium]
MSNEISLLKDGLFTTEGGKAALTLGHCKDCDTSFFPNRPFCSRCASDNIEQVSASKGKLYSFTTVI